MKYSVIKMTIENAGKSYAAYFKNQTSDLSGETVIAEFNTVRECQAFCKEYGIQEVSQNG